MAEVYTNGPVEVDFTVYEVKENSENSWREYDEFHVSCVDMICYVYFGPAMYNISF